MFILDNKNIKQNKSFTSLFDTLSLSLSLSPWWKRLWRRVENNVEGVPVYFYVFKYLIWTICMNYVEERLR